MIRKKGEDGEVVLSIETEDEFGKALATGEAVELTRELAEQLGRYCQVNRFVDLLSALDTP